MLVTTLPIGTISGSNPQKASLPSRVELYNHLITKEVHYYYHKLWSGGDKTTLYQQQQYLNLEFPYLSPYVTLLDGGWYVVATL